MAAKHKPTQSRITPPPQSISLKTRIIAQEITFPSSFTVSYARFLPTSTVQQFQDVDTARRSLVGANSSQPLLSGFLPYVDVSKGSVSLWVFHVAYSGSVEDLEIEWPNFQGLHCSQKDSFSYQDIYPCSSACSERREPCTSCTAQYCNSRLGLDCYSQRTSPSDIGGTPNVSTPLFSSCSTPTPTSSRSASTLLPRVPLRKAHDFFLSAIRERYIDELCRDNPCLRRMCNGFLLGFSEHQYAWGDGWDHHVKLRPLIFCQIEVTLFSSAVLLQPSLKLTKLLPVSVLVPGTPINLLPYFTPAFYLNRYTGSKSALIRQFRTSVEGLGCGRWPLGSQGTNEDSDTQFIIAWLGVENKQGEEKGMMVVWPTDLCVTLESSSKQGSDLQSDVFYAYNRKQLTHIPELPPALQSSPIPAPATVPAQRGVSPNDYKAPVSGSCTDWATSPQNEPSPLTPFQVHPQFQIRINRPLLTRARSSFFTNMLYSHKALTSVVPRRQNFRRVSTSVGKFVDSVAKDRERERERMRKEREAAAAGQAQKEQTVLQPIASTSAAAAPSVGISTTLARASRAIVNDVIPPTATPSITVTLQPLTFPTSTQQLLSDTSHLPTYPSPPVELMKSTTPGPRDNQVAPPSVAQITHIDITRQDTRSSEEVEFSNAFGLEIADFSMDFGQGAEALSGANQHAATVDALQAMDLDLSIFTDDDFNFFDDPATNSIALSIDQSTEQADVAMGVASIPLTGLGISTDFTDAAVSTLFPGTPLPSDSHSSSWIDEAFNTGVSAFGTSFSAPELVPPSPDKSTSSASGPATPDVLFVVEIDAPQSSSSDEEPFNAIIFPGGIQKVDYKYTHGKFVTQSEGTGVDIGVANSASAYVDATDPRHAIVKKLISKRKGKPGSLVEVVPVSPFYEEHTDWVTITDESSDVGSASEHDSDEESRMDDSEGLTASRPTTPLPSNIPPGPLLLATQFTHPALLPLTTSLRSPGAPFSIPDLTSPIPNPVPTPVSPAAIVGAASERSRSLETAARALCREAVENVIWLDAWRANNADPVECCNKVDNLAYTGLHDYMQRKGLDLGGLSIDHLCEIASVHTRAKDDRLPPSTVTAYKPPEFSVGKGNFVISVLPSAVSFWGKLGLGPRGGPKDITAFVIFQGRDEEQEQIYGWLKRVSVCYSNMGFGNHILGNARLGGRDGVVPVNFDSFRKSLTSLVESLETKNGPVIFYVAVPTSSLSLSSLALRQVLSGIRRIKSTHDEKHLHFHFLPDNVFAESEDYASTLVLEALVLSVYDRIKRPVQRMISRPYSEGLTAAINYFSAPAFALAHPLKPSVSISYKYPLTNAGVLERHTFLHVGYKLSPCRKWVLAACIDQRGEGSDVGIWLVQNEHDWRGIVENVWKFSESFFKQADLEWRVVFAKLGSIGEDELEAWNYLFTSDPPRVAPLHISVVSVDDDAGWLFFSSPQPLAMSPTHPTIKASDSTGQPIRPLFSSMSTTCTLPHLLRIPLLSPLDIDALGGRDFIPDESDEPSTEFITKNKEYSRLRPLQTGVLFDVSARNGINGARQSETVMRAAYIHLLSTQGSSPTTYTGTDEEHHKDIIHNYYELVILTQTRWRHHKTPPTLPFHLAALCVMEEVLMRNNCGTSLNDAT